MRMQIQLTERTWEKLMRLALAEHRTTKEQAVYLIERGLISLPSCEIRASECADDTERGEYT
jgi:hypothetical protein